MMLWCLDRRGQCHYTVCGVYWHGVRLGVNSHNKHAISSFKQPIQAGSERILLPYKMTLQNYIHDPSFYVTLTWCKVDDGRPVCNIPWNISVWGAILLVHYIMNQIICVFCRCKFHVKMTQWKKWKLSQGGTCTVYLYIQCTCWCINRHFTKSV